ncbi:hypothetical protein ACFOSC_22000 [Streptantibioticus rubrisoli]|uniref:Lipoprotein n=1 Tax=Streptantibioticus rubrisoli TaxID=1387313 RepID=A0ABT1P5I9_9ACTN|nr:hypothetical protein [Streptantibioticus rubrisoli]MCQ4040632.1 hypothetical protein [Streptantibioticus rubrisoli]
MKKSLVRGAAVAFMSAAVVLPLSGVAQAMTPAWHHHSHCGHHHNMRQLWNDGWSAPWAWRDHRGLFERP